MNDKFVCSECGHDIFIDLGTTKFANIKFRGFRCEKCDNLNLLEENEYNYVMIDNDLDQKRLLFEKK